VVFGGYGYGCVAAMIVGDLLWNDSGLGGSPTAGSQKKKGSEEREGKKEEKTNPQN
jgi:hypothetical protein